MEIRLADVKIEPILSSIQRLNISDEEYFSDKYRDYISNSRLKYINPSQEGSPSMYKNGIPKETTQSLALGSAVHCCLLQPDEFHLAEDLKRPSAKLGQVCDAAIKYRNEGKSIKDAIVDACIDVGYYVNGLTPKRIRNVIDAGLYYHYKMKENPTGIILSSKDRETVLNCIANVEGNKRAMNLLQPKDTWGDPIDSYNEDALFIDFKCTYKGKSAILKFKMKADNWTIDKENKKLVLNDLKTSSKLLSMFMGEHGSFAHYHYSRQMAAYLWVLYLYCQKEYSVDKTWDVSANMIVVETTGENNCGTFRVSRQQLTEGKKEFCRLMKMVGYCEMFDYDDNIEFI